MSETRLPEQDDPYYDEGDDEYYDDLDCSDCDGDGYQFGEDLAEFDPFWYDAGQVYRCRNCGGSGKRKDMTIW